MTSKTSSNPISDSREAQTSVRSNRDRIEDLATHKITDELPGNLDKLKKALKVLNIRHVYLTEYPTALLTSPAEMSDLAASSLTRCRPSRYL